MTDVPTNAVMWAGVVGFLMPILVSIVVQASWPDWAKSLVAFAASLIAGAGTAHFAGNLVGRDVVSNALIVFTVGIATYYGFWKPTGIAPKIESATSFGRE